MCNWLPALTLSWKQVGGIASSILFFSFFVFLFSFLPFFFLFVRGFMGAIHLYCTGLDRWYQLVIHLGVLIGFLGFLSVQPRSFFCSRLFEVCGCVDTCLFFLSLAQVSSILPSCLLPPAMLSFLDSGIGMLAHDLGECHQFV
ncbi:hypothetical protein FN846DRAFT_716842 [Sphaerosporella brunnea]|uniref:Transmembrane protein n=1 Tax=Sphaerosporella brunnea TaxID=1250544 RepID=A0A5J5EYE8_9PEZI|nr:hypothetical protein FN846DRAFT_716842 [Sphaerosporella brunnea]